MLRVYYIKIKNFKGMRESMADVRIHWANIQFLPWNITCTRLSRKTQKGKKTAMSLNTVLCVRLRAEVTKVSSTVLSTDGHREEHKMCAKSSSYLSHRDSNIPVSQGGYQQKASDPPHPRDMGRAFPHFSGYLCWQSWEADAVSPKDPFLFGCRNWGLEK